MAINKRTSRIFTNGELQSIEARKKGDKSDPYGTYSNRVKPKIKELLKWCKRKKELERLLNGV